MRSRSVIRHFYLLPLRGDYGFRLRSQNYSELIT
jgi:hypothetical protein